MSGVSLYRVFWYIGNGITVGLAAKYRVPKFFWGYIFYTEVIHRLIHR